MKEAHWVEESDGVGAPGLLLLRLLRVGQEVELLNPVPERVVSTCIISKTETPQILRKNIRKKLKT